MPRDQTKGCKYPGCDERDTVAQVMILVRRTGRAGRQGKNVVKQKNFTVCEEHVTLFLNGEGIFWERKQPQTAAQRRARNRVTAARRKKNEISV